jgi:type IV pilus assembly protein PilA
MQGQKGRKGFTLIELVIVLGIILIIAALAIPCFTSVKINANEASAIASIRAIQSAQASYQTTYSRQGYAGSLASLGSSESCTPSPETACLLDEGLASGTKAGYIFALVASHPVNGANTTYVASAAPTAYNHSGVRRFCSTEKNTIRWDANTEGSTIPPTAEECMRFQAWR